MADAAGLGPVGGDTVGVRIPPPALRGSGGAAADQPDGPGDEQHRDCEQPARLDDLHGPERADRVVRTQVQPGQHVEAEVDAEGFGDTAFATDLVVDKTGTLNPEEIFNQSVYQFASTRAASSFCTTPLTQGPPQPTQSSGCPLHPLISGPVT